MIKDNIKKVKRTHQRGGIKGVINGAFGKLILDSFGRKIDINLDEYDICHSNNIIDKKNEYAYFKQLPKTNELGPLSETESLYPFDNREKNFWQESKYSYRSDFICEIEDVRLLGPTGLGVSKNNKIIEDTVTIPYKSRHLKRAIRKPFAYYPLLTLETLYTSRRSANRSSQTVDRACSLFNWWSSNYYHWVIEHLPKLRGVEYYESDVDKNVKFILPNNGPDFIYESLELLGINPSNHIRWRSPAIDVKNLVLPSFPEANPDNLYWLRSRLKEAVKKKKNSVEYPKRIYISRNKSSGRKITNENQFVNLINNYGFERIFTEELSLTEQIKMFSNADTVISPHGAGLTNIVWGDKMTVFEIHNNVVKDPYYVLSNNLGHDYIPIQGDSKQSVPDINSNIRIDLDRVEEELLKL